MNFLKLDRPLAVFDIEATGLSPTVDRIIEISVIRIEVSGRRSTRTWLLNPTIPIPVESIAIHGITDEEVARQPTFAEVAYEMYEFFSGCDLAGFGMDHLDIPLLEEEFRRAGFNFAPRARRQFDAMRIFHRREPRNLAAALKFYCGEDLLDGHGAAADAAATLKVLEGEFAKYPDLPRDPEALDKELNERDPFALDREGRLRWVDGEITINFGKNRGKKLRVIMSEMPGFLKWILKGDFAPDTKEIIRNIMQGNWPETPAITATTAAFKPETLEQKLEFK